ncbi:MAG: ATP-binding protein, partial [Alistipes sp.]|nr:ATP-binding protein [Alistipes sp.]
MKLSSIEIKNFKSIEEITIPVRSYGEGMHKSNTLIMIGINPCGKSNILEAIKLRDVGSTAFVVVKCPAVLRVVRQESFHFRLGLVGGVEAPMHHAAGPGVLLGLL